MRCTPQSRRRRRMKSATSSATGRSLRFGSGVVVPHLRNRNASYADLPSRTQLEAEHVRPVVVADRVEALALLVEPRGVEPGVEDRLLVPGRAGEVGTVGAQDRRAA